MRSLIVAAVVAGALGSVIPKSDAGEATRFPTADVNTTDNNALTGGQYSSVVFWEFPHFQGYGVKWLWEAEPGAGDDPDTAFCWEFPGNMEWASSIEFRQDGRRISCSFYSDRECHSSYLWLGSSEPDLSTRGWNKQVRGAKCWLFDHGVDKKREETVVANTDQSGFEKRVEGPSTELATRNDDEKELIPVPNGPIAGGYWVMIVYEHPNYEGNGWGYPEEWLKTKSCSHLPTPVLISSIRFNVDRNRIMCTGYTNGECQDSGHTNGELGIVANFPDLKRYGFDDVLRTFKCWNHANLPSPVNGTVLTD